LSAIIDRRAEVNDDGFRHKDPSVVACINAVMSLLIVNRNEEYCRTATPRDSISESERLEYLQ